MGKGDQRTRRGKIYRGTFGKTRLKAAAKAKRSAELAKAADKLPPAPKPAEPRQ